MTRSIRSRLRAERATQGFTMMEVIAVVALIAIIMAVAFVGLWQLRISLVQMELDATARELYVAAQNHLSSAYGQGLQKKAEQGEASEDGVHYFVYNPSVEATDVNNPNNTQSALSLMLPFASIDETVRRAGSYIVSYQPATGKVIEVFFAKPAGFGAYSFAASVKAAEEYASATAVSGDEHAGDRRDYDGNGSIIGWYDGEEASGVPDEPIAPTVLVYNGDKLVVSVRNPSANASAVGGAGNLQLKLVAQGELSGASMSFELKQAGELDVAHEKNAADSSDIFTVVLDDIVVASGQVADDTVAANGRFRSVVQRRSAAGALSTGANGCPFVPGENLDIFAWATASPASGRRSAVAISPTVIVNSSFGTGTAKDGEHTLTVSSIRHLENLDTRVSGYDPGDTIWPAGTGLAAGPHVSVKQTAGLSWKSFMNHTGAVENGYLPVSPAYRLSYDGAGHSISHIKVEAPGDAGLFGALSKQAEISNVLLWEADFSGDGNAGGLVGSTSAPCTIDSCAAVPFVYAGTGSAGGLVGESTNELVITRSYAAGHTLNGSYDNPEEPTEAHRYNSNVQADSGSAGGLVGHAEQLDASCSYSTCSVFSDSAIGITADTLAADADGAGGLVGKVDKGSITSSYATGLVTAEHAARGAFAGVLGTGVTLGKKNDDSTAPARDTRNRYYSIINEETGPLGSGDEAALVEFGGSAESYDAFMTGTARGSHIDPTLPNVYPAPTIAMLDPSLKSGEQDSEGTDVTPFDAEGTVPHIEKPEAQQGKPVNPSKAHLYMHYGDWPQKETFFVNTKSS